ncbi:MAG: carboxypeptidase regulatory-like domain-containing protein [Chloroflexi bacterium]|nr:carboxypeptidase regulatory-like domain-containing protein [Chloroflexota bacterium]
MRRHLLAAAALVGALLVALVPGAAGLVTPAHAQANGAISGQVVNGTAGGPTVAGAELTVHILKDRAKVGEKVVTTDAEGRFTADGLETGPSYIYFPIIEYGGVPYYPDQPVILDDTLSKTIEIRVFEPSTSPDGIAFERANMLVMDVTSTAMTIMEMGAIVNGGDHTYVGAPHGDLPTATLQWSLPRGAMQVTPQVGLPSDTLASTPDGFLTSIPLPPGRHEVAFSYQLPFDSSTFEVTKSQIVPTKAFTLFLPDNGMNVAGPGLVLQGTSALGGQQYRQYVIQDVGASVPVKFVLSNLPAPWFGRPRDIGLLIIAVGTLALIVFVAFALRRRRLAAAPVLVSADVERAELVRSLAALDERYAAGQIEEAAYHAERDVGKARLVALLTPTVEAR